MSVLGIPEGDRTEQQQNDHDWKSSHLSQLSDLASLQQPILVEKDS